MAGNKRCTAVFIDVFIKTCSLFFHQFRQLIKSKSSGHTVQSITDEKTRVLVCDFEYYSESTAFFNLPPN